MSRSTHTCTASLQRCGKFGTFGNRTRNVTFIAQRFTRLRHPSNYMDSIPDRPARSELLYRLSYPCPQIKREILCCLQARQRFESMRLYPAHLTIRNLHLTNKFFPKIIYSNSNRITLSVFEPMQLENRL